MDTSPDPEGREGSRCGARLRQSEGRCKKPAGWGTDHVGEGPCRLHGGNTRSVRKGAHLRLVERRMNEAVATYGLPVEIGPADALLAEVHRTAGHVAWLQEQVSALEADALTWGVSTVKTGGQDGGVTETAEPHVLLKLYQQERAHLVRVSAEAIRCGIEERRVRLAESHGALVAGVVRAILGDLNLTAEQQQLVPEVVPRRLRELAA